MHPKPKHHAHASSSLEPDHPQISPHPSSFNLTMMDPTHLDEHEPRGLDLGLEVRGRELNHGRRGTVGQCGDASTSGDRDQYDQCGQHDCRGRKIKMRSVSIASLQFRTAKRKALEEKRWEVRRGEQEGGVRCPSHEPQALESRQLVSNSASQPRLSVWLLPLLSCRGIHL